MKTDLRNALRIHWKSAVIIILSIIIQIISTIINILTSSLSGWLSALSFISLFTYSVLTFLQQSQKIERLEKEIQSQNHKDYWQSILETICGSLQDQSELRAWLFLIGKEPDTGKEVLYVHETYNGSATERKLRYEKNQGIVGLVWSRGAELKDQGLAKHLPDPNIPATNDKLRNLYNLTERQIEYTKHLRTIIALPLFTYHSDNLCLIGVLSIDSPNIIKVENKKIIKQLNLINYIAKVNSKYLPTDSIKIGLQNGFSYLIQLKPNLPN